MFSYVDGKERERLRKEKNIFSRKPFDFFVTWQQTLTIEKKMKRRRRFLFLLMDMDTPLSFQSQVNIMINERTTDS